MSCDGFSMGKSDALDQAASRLTAAVDGLEDCVTEIFDESDPVGSLREQVRFLNEKCAQLSAELERERQRARRLEAANDEVSGRLENAATMLRELIPLPG
jgi:chromosome segregation ATPase